MQHKAILNIPHSSTHIPYTDGYIAASSILNDEILKLTDWFTDDIFYSEDDIVVKANFSRIFCDVERFENDEQEVMSKKGMGVLYEKTDDGKIMRNINPKLRERIIHEYYRKHHQQLNKEVEHQLNVNGKALIIDCHSFPSTPFTRDLDQRNHRPDFNIGTDPFHTPKKLINKSVEFFKRKGYSLGINWPYQGTIVPMKYFQQNKNVNSIMLEINRKLYLKESTNEKSKGYEEVKMVVKEYIKLIKHCI